MLKCNLKCLQRWYFGSFCCNHSTLFADNISDFEDILCDKWSKWSTKRVTHCTFISILYLTVHLANTFNALSAWIIDVIERKRMSPTMAYSYFWGNVQMWGFWRKCCLREAIQKGSKMKRRRTLTNALGQRIGGVVSPVDHGLGHVLVHAGVIHLLGVAPIHSLAWVG